MLIHYTTVEIVDSFDNDCSEDHYDVVPARSDLTWVIKQCRSFSELLCAFDAFGIQVLSTPLPAASTGWWILSYGGYNHAMLLQEKDNTVEVPEIPEGDEHGSLWRSVRDHRQWLDHVRESDPWYCSGDPWEEDDELFPEESDDNGAAWFEDCINDVRRRIDSTENLRVLKATEKLVPEDKYWKAEVQHCCSETSFINEDGEADLCNILSTAWPNWDEVEGEVELTGLTSSGLSKIYTVTIKG